jgi:hypothetical protein
MKIQILLLFVMGTANILGQTQVKPFELPNISLMLEVENPTWRSSGPAVTTLTIQNNDTKKEFLVLSPGIVFEFAERTIVGPSMRDAVFWSPVSLTKTYEGDKTGCQSDLTKDRESYLKDSKIRVIKPSTYEIKLLKSEKKEFIIDLNTTCWQHAISSIYPNQLLFSMIGKYPPFSGKKYKLHYKMYFRSGSVRHEGVEIPLSKNIRSNEVEITVN